jgi:hypothetical protein
MKNIATKTITQFRNNIFFESEKRGITAVTRGGEFVGVFISAGDIPKPIKHQIHHAIRHNPEHSIGILTRRVIA